MRCIFQVHSFLFTYGTYFIATNTYSYVTLLRQYWYRCNDILLTKRVLVHCGSKSNFSSKRLHISWVIVSDGLTASKFMLAIIDNNSPTCCSEIRLMFFSFNLHYLRRQKKNNQLLNNQKLITKALLLLWMFAIFILIYCGK